MSEPDYGIDRCGIGGWRTAPTRGLVLANAWKETVRDAMADIAASMEAAKAEVRRAITRRTDDPVQRKRIFAALRADRWSGDPFLARQIRQHWRRGKNGHPEGVPRTSPASYGQASLCSFAAGDPMPTDENHGPVTDRPTEKISTIDYHLITPTHPRMCQ